jgi:hypothetical protein
MRHHLADRTGRGAFRPSAAFGIVIPAEVWERASLLLVAGAHATGPSSGVSHGGATRSAWIMRGPLIRHTSRAGSLRSAIEPMTPGRTQNARGGEIAALCLSTLACLGRVA